MVHIALEDQYRHTGDFFSHCEHDFIAMVADGSIRQVPVAIRAVPGDVADMAAHETGSGLPNVSFGLGNPLFVLMGSWAGAKSFLVAIGSTAMAFGLRVADRQESDFLVPG